MDVTINTAADLKFEIARLKQVKTGQEIAIKQHFNSPRAILGTVISLFNKNKTGSAGGGNYDIGSLISKFLLSFTLNKTFFRKSNFMVKAIVRLLSQKASHWVNNKNMRTIWRNIRSHVPHSLIQKIAPQKSPSLFSSFLAKRRQKQRKLRAIEQ